MSGETTSAFSFSTTQETRFNNSTAENVNNSYTYKLPFTEAWVIASATILLTFFVFGVTANSITIAVIRTSSRLKNRYYTFLASMCCSDILSAFMSIIFLYRRTWGFLYFAWPEFFCRLYWGVDLWTSFATALHILSFAILRLIGVRWPTKFQRIKSLHMKIWIGCIWGVTFIVGFIPHFLFNTVKIIDREHNPDQSRWASCSLAPEWLTTWQVYVQIVYALFLFLPAVSIIGISVAIAVLLRKHRIPGEQSATAESVSSHSNHFNSATVQMEVPHSTTPRTRVKRNRPTASERRWKKDKQAIYQLFLIVGSFLLGYIPLTAFHFYTGISIHESSPEINAFDWRFAMVQYIMLRFSECLNPVFYNLASKKMRSETMRMLRKCFQKSPGRMSETYRVRKKTGNSSSGI